MRSSLECERQAELLDRSALSAPDPIERQIYENMAAGWRQLAELARERGQLIQIPGVQHTPREYHKQVR